MRIVGFAGALIVIFALFMPWFHSTMLGYESVSFYKMAESTYSNLDEFLKTFQYLAEHDESGKTTSFLGMYFLGVLFITLGALIGLTGGRGGHILGLIGMALFTAAWYMVFRDHLFDITDTGYYLSWVGFLIGAIGGGGGKK
ncbi:amino acid permease [Thermococcus gammatolerans]|nr:amino acid permease [Thermococcus gammatolerans]